MTDRKIAKNSVWTRKDSYTSMDVTATVVDVRKTKDDEYVTYIRMSDGMESIHSLEKSVFICAFKRAEDFFATGRQYRYKREWPTSKSTTYHILETYVVSKPMSKWDRLAARAIAVTADDKRRMVMLGLKDFEDMSEVVS